MAEEIEARIITKIGTDAEWESLEWTPLKGELIIVTHTDQRPYNLKAGNGIDGYEDLPFMLPNTAYEWANIGGDVTDNTALTSNFQQKLIAGSGISIVGNTISATGSGGGGGGGDQTLQEVLNKGRVGDSMQITTSMQIPTVAPSLPASGNIYVGAGATAGTIESGSIIAGSNVTITGDLSNRLLGSGDITINASGGGGGDQDLNYVLSNGNTTYNYGINLLGSGVSYGYTVAGGGVMYGDGVSGKLMFKADTGYYLTSLAQSSGTKFLTIGAGGLIGVSDGSSGSGTVTSVGLSMPTAFSVSGSPITSNGTLAVTLNSGYKIPTTTEWDGKVPVAGNVSITGDKDFIGSLLYNGEEVATLQDLSTVFKYKGSVATFSSLPTSGNVIGDTWNVNDTGKNYAWNGTAWDDLGGNVDLSNYYTKSQVDALIPSSLKQSQWDVAYTQSHTHSNKSNLDTINQNLSTTSNVQFSGVNVTSVLQIPNTSSASARALYIGSGATASSPENAIASNTVLGGVKVGTSLSINPTTGVLDVNKVASNSNAVSANATDLASAISLINELKGVINDLQNKMRTANILNS